MQPQRSQRDVLEELVEVIRTVERRTRSLDEPTAVIEEPPKFPPGWERKAKSLMRKNKKFDAIKFVRLATNWGLMSAKDLVESWGDSLEPEWEEQAQLELRNGNKLNAIKIVRTGTGLGFQEAKELVEYWQ